MTDQWSIKGHYLPIVPLEFYALVQLLSGHKGGTSGILRGYETTDEIRD